MDSQFKNPKELIKWKRQKVHYRWSYRKKTLPCGLKLKHKDDFNWTQFPEHVTCGLCLRLMKKVREYKLKSEAYKNYQSDITT